MRQAEHSLNHLSVKDYDYHSYSVDFKKMQSDLLYTGASLIVLGSIMLPLLAVAWFQDPSLITLLGFWLGGIIGMLPPRLGFERSKLIEYFGLAEHFTSYEHKLQVVIWKFKNNIVVAFLAVPYFLWIFFNTFNNNLLFGNNFGNAFAVVFLSALCIFGFIMGLLNLQVYWSIHREIISHKKKAS